MLFSNPDYPIFLIAVFFLYALARGHGVGRWARVLLMVLLGDLIFVLISKDPSRLWDPFGGLLYSNLLSGDSHSTVAYAPWWHYVVGAVALSGSVGIGWRYGAKLASDSGQRWIGIGFCIVLIAVAGLVQNATQFNFLPSVTRCFVDFGHLIVLVLVGIAIGASFVAQSRTLARLLVLFVVSSLFYQAWAVVMHGPYRYLLALLLATIVLDFYLALAIERTESPFNRRLLLIVSLVSNLGILAVFKYADFFRIDVLHLDVQPYNLILPAGISFHTFQSMSYTVDVYRRELPATKSVTEFATFVLFFPQLVAGPIVRAADLLPQLSKLPELDHNVALDGLFRIVVGLFKKIALADLLDTVIVARVFEAPEHFSSLEVAAGVVGFAFQIYLDFSAYSDIAIGSAQVLGFRLPENFRTPYRSANLQEFWRRWHMSLSSWLRDYLYISLGGGRGSNLATYRNLIITMLLGGLWHGARWTYIVWGALHGGGLAVTRYFQRRCEAQPGAVPRLFAYCSFGVVVGIVVQTNLLDGSAWWLQVLVAWCYLTPLWAMSTIWLSMPALLASNAEIPTRLEGGRVAVALRAAMALSFAGTLVVLKYAPSAWWLPMCVLVWCIAIAGDMVVGKTATTSPWHSHPVTIAKRSGSALLVFVYVCIAWIFFRAESCSVALTILSRLMAGEYDYANVGTLVRLALVVGFLTHIFPDHTMRWLKARWCQAPAPLQGILLAATVLVLRELSTPHFVQFIYFQF
jgi:alginate O-acetyltransferase complex protein AlgI